MLRYSAVSNAPHMPYLLDDSVEPHLDCAMARIVDFAAPLGQKAGPGRWNDLDMLEIGNGGMTFDEYGMIF